MPTEIPRLIKQLNHRVKFNTFPVLTYLEIRLKTLKSNYSANLMSTISHAAHKSTARNSVPILYVYTV